MSHQHIAPAPASAAQPVDPGRKRANGGVRSAWPVTLVLGLPIAWLAWAAAIVDVEPYDGFETICNALYFAGHRTGYIGNRAPLLSILLTPARLLSSLYTSDPLHVCTYHVGMAVCHAVYLVGVYLCMRRFVASRTAQLVAFVSAVLNLVFFSYAPFLSHDIFPGLLLLLMLLLAEDFAREPNFGRWLLLVALGCASVLTKQTYGLFWFALVVGRCLPLAVGDGKLKRTPVETCIQLGLGAVTSAVIYWLVIGAVLGGAFPSTPLLRRPLLQIQQVMTQYQGTTTAFPVWIYVRNFPFYGVLTTVFIIPGLWMLLRRDRLCQSLALTWIVCFAGLHLVGVREVRYAAFLAPLSAIAVAQPVAALLRGVRRSHSVLIGLLLTVDILLASTEAVRLVQPFYRHNQLREFLSVSRDDQGWRKPVLTWKLMGFMPPGNSPFAGDRYHRMFHFGAHHLESLYGYAHGTVGKAPSLRWLQTQACQLRNSVLFFTSEPLRNGTGLLPGPPTTLAEHAMFACRAEPIAATVGEEGWRLEDGTELSADETRESNGTSVRIRTSSVDKRGFDRYLFPCIRNRTDRRHYALTQMPGGGYRVAGMSDAAELRTRSDWEFWGYRIHWMSVPAVDRPGTYLLHVD